MWLQIILKINNSIVNLLIKSLINLGILSEIGLKPSLQYYTLSFKKPLDHREVPEIVDIKDSFFFTFIHTYCHIDIEDYTCIVDKYLVIYII